MQRLVGDGSNAVSMSSTKSAIGHLLGGGGRGRGGFQHPVVADQIVPPTLNLHNPPASTRIDLVPFEPRKRDVEFALSNSFGFGGTNACLILTQAH